MSSDKKILVDMRAQTFCRLLKDFDQHGVVPVAGVAKTTAAATRRPLTGRMCSIRTCGHTRRRDQAGDLQVCVQGEPLRLFFDERGEQLLGAASCRQLMSAAVRILKQRLWGRHCHVRVAISSQSGCCPTGSCWDVDAQLREALLLPARRTCGRGEDPS